jgi:hypothetical protein
LQSGQRDRTTDRRAIRRHGTRPWPGWRTLCVAGSRARVGVVPSRHLAAAIDGHEDATPTERSPDGEAANMEIAVLLGMTGEGLPQPLGRAFGASHLVLL